MRKLDELGRVVLPIEIRERFGQVEGFDIDLSPDGKQIILTPAFGEQCSCCLKRKDILHCFKGIQLCDDCIEQIRTAKNL